MGKFKEESQTKQMKTCREIEKTVRACRLGFWGEDCLDQSDYMVTSVNFVRVH